MLALGDNFYQARDVQRVGAQGPGRDLTMDNQRGDVRVVGGDLPPAFSAVVGGHAQETHELIAESFNSRDLHTMYRSCLRFPIFCASASPDYSLRVYEGVPVNHFCGPQTISLASGANKIPKSKALPIRVSLQRPVIEIKACRIAIEAD